MADPEPSSSKLKEMGKRFNLSFFDRIFTVSEEDAQSLRQKYGMTKEHVIAAGDTKYDRALERAEANQAAARQYLDQLKQKFPSRPIVVLGSVYTQDWTLCFGRADLIAAAAYLPLIVPHNVDSYTISTAIADAKNAGLQPIRWSQLRQAEPSVNVIIVDQLGCLAELYACANAAYVGGAQHHKVHNVLEPAAYNLPIAHGPKYQNSREAAMMSGLNKVVSTADEFADWVMTAIHEPGKTKSFVEAQAGATEFLTEKCWPETSRKSINPAPANSNV